jgi:hypothetical protein
MGMPSHCATCVCAFHEPHITVEEIDAQILSLKARLAVMKATRNALVPLHRLPLELLQYIFQCTVYQGRPSLFGSSHVLQDALKLSSVCVHWRKCATAEPSLWSVMMNPAGNLLPIILARSREIPLHIGYFGLENPSVFRPHLTSLGGIWPTYIDPFQMQAAFPLVFTHATRINTLLLVADRSFLRLMLSVLPNLHFPQLQTLSVYLFGSDPYYLDDLKIVAPNLQSLKLDNAEGRSATCNAFLIRNFAGLSRILSLSELVEYLDVSNAICDPLVDSQALIQASCLKSLRVRDWFDKTMALLTRIVAPRLEELTVYLTDIGEYSSERAAAEGLLPTFRPFMESMVKHGNLRELYLHGKHGIHSLEFRCQPDISGSNYIKKLRLEFDIGFSASDQILTTAGVVSLLRIYNAFRLVVPSTLFMGPITGFSSVIQACDGAQVLCVYGLSPDDDPRVRPMIPLNNLPSSIRIFELEGARFDGGIIQYLSERIGNKVMPILRIIRSQGVKKIHLSSLQAIAHKIEWDQVEVQLILEFE